MNPAPVIGLFFLLAAGAAVLLALLIIIVLVRWLRGRTAPAAVPEADLSIDLTALRVGGPPGEGPQLEYYGTPVRLVVIVLAPAGRGAAFPPQEKLRDVVDRLIPDLPLILDWHRPIYRRWPEQLSSQGFAQSFFHHVRLPGDRGRGTPWCSVAGRFDSGEGYLLAGLACRADRPNGLSQVVVQHEGQWNDVLRVKSRGP